MPVNTNRSQGDFDNKLKLHHQRVRWWSALALLRALASSPAAAAATLKNRSVTIDAATVEDINMIGQKMVFDLDSHDSIDASDLILGSKIEDDSAEVKLTRSHSTILKQLADEAENLCGEKDNKMLQLAADLKKLFKDGFRPIVFCRFIRHCSEKVDLFYCNLFYMNHLQCKLPQKMFHTEAQRHRGEYPMISGLSVPQCLCVRKNHHFHATVSYYLLLPLRTQAMSMNNYSLSYGTPEIASLTLLPLTLDRLDKSSGKSA